MHKQTEFDYISVEHALQKYFGDSYDANDYAIYLKMKKHNMYQIFPFYLNTCLGNGCLKFDGDINCVNLDSDKVKLSFFDSNIPKKESRCKLKNIYFEDDAKYDALYCIAWGIYEDNTDIKYDDMDTYILACGADMNLATINCMCSIIYPLQNNNTIATSCNGNNNIIDYADFINDVDNINDADANADNINDADANNINDANANANADNINDANTNANNNSGKKWTQVETNSLVDEIDSDINIENVSKIHGRTTGAIIAKVKQLVNNNIISDTIIKKYSKYNQIYTKIEQKDKKDKKDCAKEMIYILQLEHDKYYVGWTKRAHCDRFDEHFNGEGSEWTKKYKPVQVLKYIEGTKQDEDRITLNLMKEVGWYNVRGGKWCKVDMTQPPEELNTVTDVVKKAISNAINKKNTNQYIKNVKSVLKKYIKTVKSTKISCYRCGRSNHLADNCYASTHTDGHIL
jgi:predicted GIY-YIG superfamily endonuclease